MIRRHTRSTRTYTLVPYTTLCRSHDPADREGLGRAGEGLPRQERLVGRTLAGRHAPVADDDPGEALRLGGHQAKADEAAPVLPEEGDVAQVELAEEHVAHPVDLALVGVVALLRRLVRPPEAPQVRNDAAVPGGEEGRHDLSVQVRPSSEGRRVGKDCGSTGR